MFMRYCRGLMAVQTARQVGEQASAGTRFWGEDVADLMRFFVATQAV